MSTPARRLRELLGRPAMLVAPFAYDALLAKVVEAEGYDAVYMTGFGTAAARGLPDVGLLSGSEMVANARCLAGAVGIPVVCDADTGYGNALNVRHTVRAFEAAGAAGLHIEDQVWPKRCGFLEGKQVIPLPEMQTKVRAACEARRDPDFVVIARTDALAVHGWDEAERRARAYAAAGADLVFVDGIRTRDELETYARRLADLPLVYNGTLLPVAETAALGFRLNIHGATLFAAYRGVRDTLRALRAEGRAGDAREAALGFAELVRLLGVPEVQALEQRYAAATGAPAAADAPAGAGRATSSADGSR